jgi:molybdate-binding protein
MKVGKEIKLDLLDNYKTKIGTVNNKESKSLYINLSAWGEINNIDENTNYVSVLRNLRKKIKQNLNNTLNKEIFHNNKYIVDLDMRSSGFVSTKRSFMSCEITLYQKKFLPINQPKLVDESKNLIYNVVNNCLETNNYFTFYKTKK